MQAYVDYARLNNLTSHILASSNSVFVLEISGKNAHIFDNEAGKHVVQRVPPTESKGRRHTSVISVSVQKIPSEILDISEDSIRIDRQKTKIKAGGMNTNKVESSIRAVHEETGVAVRIDGRDQHRNKAKAIKLLKTKVKKAEEEKQKANQDLEKAEMLGGGSRSDKIRTYNFINSFVTDHRTGTKTSKIRDVMRGHFELLR